MTSEIQSLWSWILVYTPGRFTRPQPTPQLTTPASCAEHAGVDAALVEAFAVLQWQARDSVFPICLPDDDIEVDNSWTWGEDLIRDTHLCTHPVAAVSCMGDSGAPLVCHKNGVYYLFGVMTWGSRRCDPSKPAVFSSIADVQLWLTETTDDIL
ncbi:hypothetical protein CRUP_015254 [Coryphaenoides rupestris]|nr:hypothetical protein CRUP_015254 [Coryphaenoides rupestris]